jgi:hypothetical protein
MATTSISDNRALLDRTASALEDHSLAPADLRRLLARAERFRRIDPGGVVRAFGLLTAYAGVAFLYIVNYGSLSLQAQRYTPFILPALVLVAAVVLDRLQRPAWEIELAAVVGEIALALTFLAASDAWGRSRSYGLWAALLSLGVSLVMYRALRLVRVTTWAAAASIVALATFIAADSNPHSVAHAFLLQGVVAAGAGFALLGRSRPVAAQALYLGTLLALIGGAVGVVADSFMSSGVSEYALALFATTLAALAVASLVELSGLLWLGAFGAVLTLVSVAEPSRGDSHWAWVMVLVGAALAGAGAFIHHARMLPPLGQQRPGTDDHP